MELAQNEITENANGIPGAGQGRRPYVLVECDQTADAVRAASYLVDTIGVPVIIGPMFSGLAISVATAVTNPSGVLMISPTATSPSLTPLEAQGLVWRTSSSDVIQGAAMVALVHDVESRRSPRPIPPSRATLRLALVVKGDSYGQGLFNLILPNLVFNGQSATAQSTNFLSVQYADTDTDPTFDFTPTDRCSWWRSSLHIIDDRRAPRRRSPSSAGSSRRSEERPRLHTTSGPTVSRAPTRSRSSRRTRRFARA